MICTQPDTKSNSVTELSLPFYEDGTISGIRGILLDIEGTTSSISFVYDVMFQYARDHLDAYLAEHWEDPTVQECLPLLAEDLQHDSVDAWLGTDDASKQQKAAAGVVSLMDKDAKVAGLKKLQGMIWKDGFTSGEMVAHLFDDVAPALKRWTDAGIDVRIYSSGSIQAQKLFFGHTKAGDLLPLLTRHYDRSLGAKNERVSYHAIASDYGLPANRIIFVSDILAELDAANEARMQVALSIRPGNKPVDDNNRYPGIESFDELDKLFRLS